MSALTRARQDLETKVSRIRADFESQQDTVASLGQVLRDPSAEETPLSRERKQLKAISDQLAAAEKELHDFNEANKSEQELLELARRRVQAEEVVLYYKERTAAWKSNRLETYDLLARAVALDAAAVEMLTLPGSHGSISGEQARECSDALTMLWLRRTNKDDSYAGAIASMKGIVSRL